MPEYLIKGGIDDVGWLICYRHSQLRCQKVFMILVDVQDTDPYTCAGSGSRVCEHCNVLDVRKYVRASMV